MPFEEPESNEESGDDEKIEADPDDETVRESDRERELPHLVSRDLQQIHRLIIFKWLNIHQVEEKSLWLTFFRVSFFRWICVRYT